MIATDLIRLKHLATTNDDALDDATDPDFVFEYVDVGAVGTGVLTEQPDKISFAEAPTRARRLVRRGDTVVSTVRTYLKAVLPIDPTLEDVVVSTGFAVVRPRSGVNDRYLSWALQSDRFIGEVVARSTGVSYPAINPPTLANIRIAFVPDSEGQSRIADFLDRETERIDALVDAKRTLIDLLAEKRTALITHAVTKGLDPSAQMKDSGIPWIGEIPAHWGVSSIGHVVDSISDGPFGSSLASKHYSASGTRVVRLGNLGQGEFLTDDAAYIPDDYAEVLAAHRLRPGDLLMAGLGDERRSLGRTVVVPPEILPAIHKADCFRLRPNQLMLGAFLASYMTSKAGSASAVALAQGTTRQRINTTIARSLPVPVPPMREQRAIDIVLTEKRSPFERTTRNLARQLDLLAEYRQALITAAVTGQLDEATLKGRQAPDEALDVDVPS